jgi:glucosamine--fructose-6-phosphate aminotransferase (isomerizing)
MSLKSEIDAQPEVLGRLLDDQADNIGKIAQAVGQGHIDYIFLAARGSSDHAGLYAKYLWGALNRLPVALATPSLFSVYERPPKLSNSLVLGISQSGQSPDIISVLAEGRRQGAPTLAITNDINSPLASVADYVIDIGAGPEKAVAATKTYTAQLLAIAMLSTAMSNDIGRTTELQRVPAFVQQVLALEEDIKRVAERYRYMQHCVVLGRGYNYATAFEWSLKLKELAYVVAESYSSADFQHGPVAIVSHGFPVFSVVPKGDAYADMIGLLASLVNERQVELLALSNEKEALALAHSPLQLPGDLPEWLSPIVCIVPAQLLCYYLTLAKGYNTEAPRGLRKITLTL